MLITTADLVAPSGRRRPRRTSFIWRTFDPDAVEVQFGAGRRGHPEQVWFLSRGLLVEGLTQGVGQVDARIGLDLPDPGSIGVRLTASVGHLRVGARELGEFLRDTLSRVPLGQQRLWMSLDAERAALPRGHHEPYQPRSAGCWACRLARALRGIPGFGGG